MPNTIVLEQPDQQTPTSLPNETPKKKCGTKTPTPPKKTLDELEVEVLKFSGLELNKDLHIFNVKIELNGKIYSIHTYRCGDNNKEDLILLHGFGGSSALYYSMLKSLSQRFRVFCIDFIGMGLSSKENFEFTTAEETMDFFLTSIDKWREAMELETFYLGGHSFGGHMATHYSVLHPDRVKKLFLLSPMGFTDNKGQVDMKALVKRVGWLKVQFFKMIMPLIMMIWNRKATPHSMTRNKPWLARRWIRNYVYKRFELKGKEAEAVNEYMFEMLSAPEGSEKAIFFMLNPKIMQATFPLEEKIEKEMEIPVDCYFGDVDYMDNAGAVRLFESKKKANFELKVVPKAAHQVTVQNGKWLAEDMVKSVGPAAEVVKEEVMVKSVKNVDVVVKEEVGRLATF